MSFPKYICSLLVSFAAFANVSILFAEAQSLKRMPIEWNPLLIALKAAGYTVRFETTPVSGAYGATNVRKKIIWIAPISVELGIGRQTLVHEAVHAAQGCPSGKYEPIGWSVSLPRVVDREIEGILYRKYPHKKFPIEREAFFMQGHPDAFDIIIKALKERCKR